MTGKIQEWPPLIATGVKPAGVPDGSLRQLFQGQNGRLLVSQFAIGPKAYHQQAFIEYERTFGRGLANICTHGDGPTLGLIEDPDEKAEWESIYDEYGQFAAQAGHMMLRSTEAEAQDFIERLQRFRKNHQRLYTDVPDPNARKAKFKIVRRGDHKPPESDKHRPTFRILSRD